MFCLGCWANLPDSATTCTKCGRPAGSGARSSAPVAVPPVAAGDLEPSGTTPPRLRLRVLALGLAAGLAAGGLLIVLRGRDPADLPATAGTRPSLRVQVEGGGGLPEIDLSLPHVPAEVPAAAPGAASSEPLLAAAREAYQAKDYDAAARSLREVLAGAPEGARGGLVQALAAALEGAGVQALARGDGGAAVAALGEAVAWNPSAGSAWKALGVAQLRAANVQGALESLETAVRLRPREARTRYLLATVLYQEGQTAAAVEHLRAAAEVAPDDPEIGALLRKVEAEQAVEEGFQEAATEHFHVTFEGGGTSEQAGYLVGLLLEEAYHGVGARLDYYPGRPVHAVLYPAEQFHDVTQSPAWAGALYDGKIRLPVGGLTDRTPALARVLAHEYTHAVVHELARGRAPVWLNEGLAQLGEGADDGLLDRFRTYVRRGGKVPSLRVLEGSFGGFTGAQAEFAYATSLAATDYLVKGYGHAAARGILERLAAGEPLPDAIQATVHMRYDDLDRAWVTAVSDVR